MSQTWYEAEVVSRKLSKITILELITYTYSKRHARRQANVAMVISWVKCNVLMKWISFNSRVQRKSIFTACHSGKLKPKTFWLAELISQFLCYLNSSKNITCLSVKLKKEFTSPTAKSTCPGLSDTTFFACWTAKNYIFPNCSNIPATVIKSLQAY